MPSLDVRGVQDLVGLVAPLNMVPAVLVLQKLHLMNSLLGLILLYSALVTPFTVFLYYGFISTVPREIDEAAIIDGCSPIGCFFKMVVPMSLNSIITVATMQAVFCWNEYINAYTFTRSTDMKTVTLGLNDYVGSMGLTDWGATFAAITVTVIPVFVFYFICSKKMLAGMEKSAEFHQKREALIEKPANKKSSTFEKNL